MRINLTTFILMIALTQVSAAIFAQKLTFSKQGTNLKEIFAEIESQTGYSVLYAPAKVNTSRKYNVKFLNTALTEVLESVLKPAALEYRIENRNILVKEQEKTFPESLADRRAAVDVRGRVVDALGEGLPGATVQVKGTNQSTMTSTSGSFLIRDVAEGGILQISYIGFKTKEIAVKANVGTVILEVANSNLDEVQVIAYGTTTRRLSTSNIGSVKAEDIDRQPVNNPLLALQGKVPGLFLSQTSGIPGSNVNVNIQGVNSIANGSAPFYVIDGVPYSADMLPALSGTIGQGSLRGGSALSFINPATIESIEVLKDADATAIYGSRAANGAILITTKKGKAGTSKVDLRLQGGWGKVAKMQELMNTEQYLMIRKEAYKNDGLPVPTPAIPDAQKTNTNYDLTVWDQNRYTDWQEELIGGTAAYQDAQASISGGSNTTRFLFGAGYHKEGSVFPGDLADVKGSAQLSVNHNSPNQKFKFQFTGNYMDDRNRLINDDLTLKAIQLAPNAPAIFNADGTLNFEPYNGISTWDNPLRQSLITYKYNTQNLVANTTLSYELLKGLDIRSSFGYTRTLSDEQIKIPIASSTPELRPTFNRTSNYSNKSIANWIIEPNLNYKRTLFHGNLDVLIGGTFQKNKNILSAFEASGFNNDEQMDNIQAASTVRVTRAIMSEYNYNAIFGRINYVFENKYILNLSGRRDGSSRFGSENLFQNFYAIGAAWIFSDENWLKDEFNWLSFGKLRASYGIIGNDQIGDYGFLSLYNSTSAEIPYQGTVGLLPGSHSNPYLQWEQTKKWNLGLDLGLSNDRILFNVNYFRNRSSNQLVNSPLPIITGFNTVMINLPAVVQNSGFEIQLESKNINKKELRWSTNFNVTIPRNKLIAFPGLETSTYRGSLIIGQPLGISNTYKFAGVDPQTGLYQFLKANGNLSTAPSSTTDQLSVINTKPKYFGGIQNNLSYKGFELDFFFQFVSQLAASSRFGNRPGIALNQPVYVLNRWQQTGDESDVGKLSSATSASANVNALNLSDYRYASAAFVRLRNVAFSWQIPEDWRTKSKVQNARIFIQGQNLLTITNHDLDPETLSAGNLPSLRTITIGLQVGF